MILDNVTDKISTNFKFETSQNASSRNTGSSPSSATTSSASSNRPPQPPMTSQPSGQGHTAQGASAHLPRNIERDVRVPELDLGNRTSGSSHAKVKLRVPLDTLRKREESGCECSDDEESKQQRTISQSTSNLLGEDPMDRMMAVPGTSGNQRIPTSQSKGSTISDSSEFSSFEELNAVTVERKTPKPAVAHRENVVDIFERQGRPLEPVTGFPSRVITRRRSDGCLNLGGGLSRRDVPQPKEERGRGGGGKCCARCGRKKNELKRRLRRFHEQLTALSSDDVELRQHLEALLTYLEGKRPSVLSTEDNEDSASEPVIINQPMPREGEGEPEIPASSTVDDNEAEEPKPEPVVYKRRFVQLDDIKSR